MNRSNNQSSRSQSSFKHNNNNLCKSKSSTKSKSSNGYQFQTIWKYRNSHRTHSTSNNLEKQNNNSIVVKLQQQQQNNLHQEKVQMGNANLNKVYETAAHQEMKQFVKMMKKNTSNFQNCQQRKNINIQVPHINNLQSEQSRNFLTNRTGTARSTKSQQKQLYESRFLDQPRNQTTNRTNNTKNTVQQPILTLNQLQKKIQDIIKTKLEKQYNQSRTSSNNCKLYQQDQLDKKLKKLIEEVRNYSSRNQDNRLSRDKQKFQQNIKDIGQKISIIEKAIALSSTQNQILKDRYSSTKKVRKHYATTSSSKKYQTSKPSIQQFLISKPSPPLHYQTTNLSTFVQPTHLAYQNQLQINQSLRKSQFVMNRQPMPRSLYQREYLYYGVLPTYSQGIRSDWNANKNKDKIKQKQNCSLINFSGKQTTYQCQFKQKVASLVDSKDLDCRRDKFKQKLQIFLEMQELILFLAKCIKIIQIHQKRQKIKTHKFNHINKNMKPITYIQQIQVQFVINKIKFSQQTQILVQILKINKIYHIKQTKLNNNHNSKVAKILFPLLQNRKIQIIQNIRINFFIKLEWSNDNVCFIIYIYDFLMFIELFIEKIIAFLFNKCQLYKEYLILILFHIFFLIVLRLYKIKQNTNNIARQNISMQRNSQHSQIPQQIHAEVQNKNKLKNWLKQSLLNIQNNVALDAHHILQKNQRKTLKLRIKQKVNQNQHVKQSRSLGDLKVQQFQLRNKLRNIKNLQKTIRLHKSNKSYDFKVKSNQQLKQLTKKYREFKQKLLEKSIILKQKQQEQKQHIKKLQKQHMQTECEERRKKIMKKLEKMQKRRKKRRQEHKQQKLKLKQLRKQKLFQKMKENFNIKNNQMNQQKYERYHRIKKQFQVNMLSLSQHERNYQEAKRQKQQKRTIRMTQSRLLPEINFYKSRFLDQIMENERLEKQKANQTIERRKLIHQRHKQFQEKVFEEFAPPLKQNSGIEEKQNKKVALDYEQIKKKGNQLYKLGQKYVIPVSKREQYAKLKALQQPIIPKTYPNYLAQLSKLPHTKKSYPSFYQQQLNKVQNAIKSQKTSKHDKLQHVKILMEKMENTSPPNLQTSENQLLARLQAKLKLLELLQ